MNKEDKKLYCKLNESIKISQSCRDTIYNTFDKLPEKEKHIEKSKVGNYDAQKIEITTLYSGSKFIVTAYCFETENDYIELYEITLKSRFDKYKSQLEEAVKSFKEV